MGVPLQEVSGGCDGDDDAGARVTTDSPADELARGLGGGPPQLREQLAPSAEERSEQPRDRQDDVTVRDLGHHRAQRPVLPGEAGRPDSQQLLQMPLHELE